MFTWVVILILIYVAVTWLLRQLRVGNYGDRYVFITGCDSGFGNLLAKKLDSMGMNVVAGCLTEKGETELVKTCSKNLKAVHIDVTNDATIVTATESVKQFLPSGKGKAKEEY